MKKHGTPRVITLDAYAASHRAITELQSMGTLVRCVVIRSSKYLNNVVEQDHRRIKQRVRAMLGFKRLETAARDPRRVLVDSACLKGAVESLLRRLGERRWTDRLTDTRRLALSARGWGGRSRF
jgi:DDE domain